MYQLLRDLIGGVEPPTLTANTFIVWEPCTHSHAEVVPGYTKYLLDLGFNVAVFMTPKRYEEGLFSRFDDPHITLQKLSQRGIRRLFNRHGLSDARGIMITTARKISGKPDFAREHALFAKRRPDQRLLLVEHDIKPTADNHSLTENIITLRASYYRDAKTTVVNPHYFGRVNITPKNTGITRFITIGAMRSKRRNTQLLTEAVRTLHESGCTNFVITVIGRGSLRSVPTHLRSYFDIKGRVDFTTLYAEMEQADFFLPLLDPDNPAHDRYITTGTSGSFQLIFGFGKPCLLAEKFAARNGFDSQNSLVYPHNAALADTMRKAIDMTQDGYSIVQTHLVRDADTLYQQSLANLRQLISSTTDSAR